MKTPKTLTLKEALNQGYTHFIFGHPSDGYQTTHELFEITQKEIDQGNLYLADKRCFAPSGITNEEIKNLIANEIAVNHYDNTGDDTDTVYDAVREIDFSGVEQRIDEALQKLKSFRWITETKLV